MIDVRLPISEMNKLNSAIADVSKTSRRGMQSLVKQSSRFFLQSVIKQTGPTRSSLAKAPAKYKYRPLVSAKGTGVNAYIRKDGKTLYRPRKTDPTNGYYYETDKGYVFSTTSRLNHKKREARGRRPVTSLKKVSKAIKYWDKKENKWAFIPYAGRKRDKSDKRFKITYALAAKGGWMGVFRLFNSKNKTIPSIGTRHSGYLFRKTKDDAMSVMTNRIKYTHKKWPQAVPTALNLVSNRIRGQEAKRIKNKMKRAWNKQRGVA